MSQTAGVTYSVIVPVFRNRDSLAELVGLLAEFAASKGSGLEVVFVVDGSPDDSLEVLRSLLTTGILESQILVLSRNFGSFSAIRAGLGVARGNFMGVMAADLQEPVEVVAGFFDLLESDQCDIAMGVRMGRDDPAVSSLGSLAYWWFYRRFINPEIPPGGVDVFGCTRGIARIIAGFPEQHTSLVGLLYWIGYRRSYVRYHRHARRFGSSGWTLRKKLRYLLDSVYAFTDLPIILLQLIGIVGLIGSTIFAIVVFVAWLTGSIQQPGYTPLMITLLASTSAILIGLGVVGSYVWRGYENGKNRPMQLIASHEVYTRQEQAVTSSASSTETRA